MMNKILFLILDLDGCLLTDDDYCLPYLKQPYNCPYFDKKSLNVLKDVCDKYNTKLILSSDWKHRFTIEQFNEILAINHFKYQIVAYTPDHYKLNPDSSSVNYYETIRASEILAYVKENNIKYWLAIDDLCIGHLLPDENFVRCRTEVGLCEVGLKEKIVEKINKILLI